MDTVYAHCTVYIHIGYWCTVHIVASVYALYAGLTRSKEILLKSYTNEIVTRDVLVLYVQQYVLTIYKPTSTSWIALNFNNIVSAYARNQCTTFGHY